MAKRKGKKRAKKNNLSLIFSLVILLCGILSIALFLALDSVILYVGDSAIDKTAFDGLKVAFGYKTTTDVIVGSVTTTFLNPSIGIIIALVLVLVGVVLCLPRKKLFSLLGGVALILAAVLFILAGKLTGLTDDVKKLYAGLSDFVEVGYRPMIGAYLGCAFSGVAGLSAILKAIIAK